MGGDDEEDEMPKVIALLSCLLQRVAGSNDQSRGARQRRISVFSGVTMPTISIQSYLERIFKYANCSPSCYIVACVYLDRFARRQPAFPINSYNVHRLLITSVMLSAKFMDDMYYNNAYYAKVGGISITEMNFLEVDFLFGLGFHLNVTPSTYHTYSSYLQTEMLMMQPQPIHINPQHPSLFNHNNELLHLCFNEDESSSHQQQLTV